MYEEKSEYIFKTGVAIAVALVISTTILAVTIIKVQNKDQTIVVTGSARKRIKSDLIVWRTNLSAQSNKLSEAFQGLTNNLSQVKAYLLEKGIREDQIIASSIATKTLHAKDKTSNGEEIETDAVSGYQLEQSLEIRSNEVDKVSKIAREVTELINKGIILESNAPEYHYTKLGNLKVEMLAEASKDAKLRAQQIASSTGSQIGIVRAARMGVLQITPPDSNDVSGYGINDTTSLEKDITAVVNISFAIN